MGYQKRYLQHECTTPRLTYLQILSITCDNASVNDAMIDELAKSLANYTGKDAHVRCFLHILNLVAKTVIKVFDAPKRNGGAETLLEKLAEGIELEEEEVRLAGQEDGNDDNVEGWSDEMDLLTDEERAELEEGILPVRMVIVKVSTIAPFDEGLSLHENS
jgi:CO/xanthine dehydrogenase Mo-binding subunit